MILNIEIDWSLKWQVAAAILTVILCSLVAYAFWLRRLKKRAYEQCGHHVYFESTLPIVGNALRLMSLKSSTGS